MIKKLILSAAVVAAIGAASLAAFNSNTPTREFSDLELANIEALTSSENPWNLRDVYCLQNVLYDCWLEVNGDRVTFPNMTLRLEYDY